MNKKKSNLNCYDNSVQKSLEVRSSLQKKYKYDSVNQSVNISDKLTAEFEKVANNN